jgi:putative aldouronate transport system substrate-binding protein
MNVLFNTFGLLGDHWAWVTMREGGWHDGVITAVHMDPAYYEIIEYMHILYSEGLIDPDFYTNNHVETIARLNSGHTMIMCQFDVFDMPGDSWPQWRQMRPLTSEISPRMINRGPGVGGVNLHFYVSSQIHDPEAFFRMIDSKYSRDWMFHWYYGPQRGVDDTWDYIEGWYWSDDGLRLFPEIDRGVWPHRNFYLYRISPLNWTGNVAMRHVALTSDMVARFTRGSQLGMRYVENIEKLNPYSVNSMPPVLIHPDFRDRFNDLGAVIGGHRTQERARFITGQRPLNPSEWDTYKSELISMGYHEYIDIFLDALFDRYGDRPYCTTAIDWR